MTTSTLIQPILQPRPLLYVSYLALEFPYGYAMQRLPTAKYLGAMVTLWSLMVTVTSVCKNYGALVTTRVLLGCFKSAVPPSLVLITAMWYKKQEQPPRVGIRYLGTGTGTIIESLISYGFQHYEGVRFTSWQIMFLVIGVITMAVGIIGTSNLSNIFNPFPIPTRKHTRNTDV
jgi:MFS family permease